MLMDGEKNNIWDFTVPLHFIFIFFLKSKIL